MGLFHKRERALAQSLVDIALCNPFTIERVRAEELVLGAAVVETGGVWRVQPGVADQRENITRYTVMAGALAGELRDKLSDGSDYNDAELELYGELFEGRREELDAISKQSDKLETHENVGHGWIWFWKRKAAG